jgi:ferredoxin
MPEPIHFHTDLYRREALEAAAEKYRRQAHIELTESGADVVARLQPLGSQSDSTSLRDEFSNEVFSATARNLRAGAAGDDRRREHSNGGDGPPPWKLLAPFGAGDALNLGWMLESLSPIRGGAATLVLHHDQHGSARVAIRRNGGAPLGVAHTDDLDFLLMNGGSGATHTEESIGRVLIALAHALRSAPPQPIDGELTALRPHAELQAAQGPPTGSATAPAPGAARRVAPHIDLDGGIIRFELDEAGVSRLALYDAVLAFADRCYLFLTRPDAHRIALQVKAREDTGEDVRALAAELTRALNRVVRHAGTAGASDARSGLPHLARQPQTLDALLAELDAADPVTLGLGYQPERGPGHEALRVLNIRGTGACNSDCVFCVEKFDPAHRSMPKADTVRQFILDAAGDHDMLFFASGEPTIHPKLFEYVELAKSVGFTAFGMSSHFRTFADPQFALRTLQAGFEYFDISLHAADAATQLDVNPIADDGRSLYEALKGLAVLYRLADALGIRISVTQKIVVSRLNVTHLEEIFRATFDRGVRHFILQPVRALNLEPDRQAIVAITEEEILPHLNEFLRRTEHLGATIKPYGFSRQHLFAGGHVEAEQNRVKNVYGRNAGVQRSRAMPAEEQRPNDGRHWIEVHTPDPGYRCRFASTGAVPLLDDGLERGFDLPFGCRMGSCGMCCARLVEGRVDQNGQFFLTEEQVRDGFVLMCQARPLSDVVLRLCTDDELDPL